MNCGVVNEESREMSGAYGGVDQRSVGLFVFPTRQGGLTRVRAEVLRSGGEQHPQMPLSFE